MKKVKVKPLTNLPVTNHLTKQVCFVNSLNYSLSENEIKQLITICNQPLIYKVLFKHKLKNKPYQKKEALDFQKHAQKGWQNQTHFVFTITDKNQNILACMDIKQNKPSAEIGYWANANHPGIMTNAISKLVKIAKKSGYKSLYALIIPTNYKSQKLVKRVGFKYSTRAKQKGKLYHKYILKLQ